MRIEVGGVRYQIQFHHRATGKRRGTLCAVLQAVETIDGTAWRVAAIGSATCHKRDQFDKRTGRDLAFKRAMQHAMLGDTISRPARTALWAVYRAGDVKGWPTWQVGVPLPRTVAA